MIKRTYPHFRTVWRPTCPSLGVRNRGYVVPGVSPGGQASARHRRREAASALAHRPRGISMIISYYLPSGARSVVIWACGDEDVSAGAPRWRGPRSVSLPGAVQRWFRTGTMTARTRCGNLSRRVSRCSTIGSGVPAGTTGWNACIRDAAGPRAPPTSRRGATSCSATSRTTGSCAGTRPPTRWASSASQPGTATATPSTAKAAWSAASRARAGLPGPSMTGRLPCSPTTGTASG